MQSITIPLPLFALGASCLTLSLLAHICSIFMLLDAKHFIPQSNVTEFPIHVPAAALITSRSPNYPLASSANHNWSTLTPPLSSGFLLHPSNHKFYAVSFYHQLHCLNSLRMQIAKGSDLVLSAHVISHADHCLDYLRESVLCSADTTLEPVHDVHVPAQSGATAGGQAMKEHIDQVAMGWNVIHRCRDWTAVRDYLENNWATWPEEYKGTNV